MIGTVIKDQYRIVELLGEGGMGVVFKALDLELERHVALKFLKSELGDNTVLLQRFRDELKTLAGFNHPNITTLFTSLTWKGRPVMVMEMVDGETLLEMVKRRGPIPAGICVPLVQQALKGVGVAHRKMIIHRDLKPANLILNQDGVVKVMDFGIAKIQNSPGLTQSNTGMGTSLYMSPEQIRGSVDTRTDIYAMGVTLYELLAGQVPFDGTSQYDIERAHIEETPKPPTVHYPHIPEAVVKAVMRAIEKQPAMRFQSADEFSAALSVGDLQSVPFRDSRVPVEVRTDTSTTLQQTPAPEQPGLDDSMPPWPTDNAQQRASDPVRVMTPPPDLGVRAEEDTIQENAGAQADAMKRPALAADKPRLMLASAVTAALLLFGAGGYWIYSYFNPPVIVHNGGGGGGTGGGTGGGSGSGGGGNGGGGNGGGGGGNGGGGGTIAGGGGSGSGSGGGTGGVVIGLPDPATKVPPVGGGKGPIAKAEPVKNGVSGRWSGSYENMCSSQGSVRVNMDLSEAATGEISGTMNFMNPQGVLQRCSLSGIFLPRERSVTLAVPSCSGVAPVYFTGRHKSTLVYSGAEMSGTVNPQDNSNCVTVSLRRMK
jgi:serine/threonine protein kinase